MSEEERKIVVIRNRIEELKEMLSNLQEKRVEYEVTKASLKELSEGDKLLVPIGSGVFIKAEVKETDKVLLNIGAEILMEDTKESTIKIIDEQIQRIDELYENALSELRYLEEILQKMAKKEKSAIEK